MPYVTLTMPNGQTQRAYIPGRDDTRRNAVGNLNPFSRLARTEGVVGGPGPNSGVGGSETTTTEDGTEFVNPGEVDFAGMVPVPFVDFEGAWDFATEVGKENKESYLTNLQDPRIRDIALDFVDTDVEGIRRSATALSPFIREQGDLDTAKNMERAGKIDAFNFSRIPSFNAFNRDQASANNEFNRNERLKSIEASGLDYRDRITDVLDQLKTQSTGSFSSPLLDTLMSRTARDRGADIASSSGVGMSPAGRNIQDRIDVNQRVSLALDAQKTIPSILTQAQGVLQPPEERAPTLYNSPTSVPLNVSNIADKIPVTSNVSAGAAQMQVGTQATNYEVIPAATALGAKLGTEQFNASGAFQHGALIAGAEQAQQGADDSALQSALNQERADAAAAAGLDARQQSEMISAGSQILGGLVSGAFSTPVGGGQSAGGQVVGSIIDGISGLFGGGGSELTEGPGAPSPSLDFSGGGDSGGGGGFSTGGGDIDSVGSAGSAEDFDLGSPGLDFSTGGGSGGGGGGSGFTLDGGFSEDVDIAQTFRETAEPLGDKSLDARLARSTTQAISQWPTLDTGQQLNTGTEVATESLESKGFLSPQNKVALNAAAQSLAVIANPNSTDAQKATAVASAAIKASFPGDPNAATANAALQAFNVLNSNASDQQKMSALTGIGISAAQANGIISSVAAGNAATGLAVFNTATNWNQMSPLHQAAAVMQTSHAVMNTFSNIATEYGSQSLANLAGSSSFSSLSTTLAGGAAIAGIGLGIKQEADVIDAAKDMPRSQAVGFASQGSAAAGAAIGAGVGAGLIATGAAAGSVVPVVGTIIGAAVGAVAGVAIGMTGTGKGSGQLQRDAWRKGLVASGIVQKGSDNAYNVTLANGDLYDIGKDGGAKLRNADGSERNTFDVDWNNESAVNAIPDAHLFAIATGLDPTEQGKFDTFHRVVAQGVNAATSNSSNYEGVRNNFKSMMKDIDPRDLAMRVEMLRVGKKISEQEYGVYLDRVNKMFGTKLVPTDLQKSKNTFIEKFKGVAKPDKGIKNFLAVLTDPAKEAEAQQRLEERMGKDANAITNAE